MSAPVSPTIPRRTGGSPASSVASPRRSNSSLGDGTERALAAAIAAVRLKDDAEDQVDDDLDTALRQATAESSIAPTSVDIESLKPERAIGLGGQGGVWLARDPASGCLCAVKQYRKSRIAAVSVKVASRAITERDALVDLGSHPFITGVHAAFQNATSLFLCLELAPGGDLFGMDFRDGLAEHHARFYSVCIALALRHLHSHGWAYRDIKLENVLVDNAGYAKLCDFGFAKKAASMRTFTNCGTEEYAAPEMVRGTGRAHAADWWAMGILVHEMFCGHPPFEGSPKEVCDAITAYAKGGEAAQDKLQAAVLEEASPSRARFDGSCEQLSLDGADFLRALLTADETARLGSGPSGFPGLLRHPWFELTDWEAMLRREVAAPWVPPAGESLRSVDFSGENVMEGKTPPYDRAKWEPRFAEFGPFRHAPWRHPESGRSY